MTAPGWIRSRRVWGAGALAAALLAAAVLVALPEIVRRVAVDRLGRLTGRTVALADVDLNVFTGRLALHGFRLARRGSTEPALAVERLEVRVAPLSLLTGNVRVRELTVAGPLVQVARLGPAELDCADLLALGAPAGGDRKPSTTTVTVERLVVTGGRVRFQDRALPEPAEWRIDDLEVEGAGLSTRAGAAPGRLGVALKLDGTPVRVTAAPLDLAGRTARGRIAVEGFDLARVGPYLAGAAPAVPGAGRLGLELTVEAAGSGPSPRVALAGDVRLEGVTLLRPGAAEPFVRLPRAVVRVAEAALPERTVRLGAVEVEGLDVRGRRSAGGIDLLQLVAARAPAPPAGAPGPGAGPAAAGPVAGGPGLRLAVQRLALRGARFTFTDELVRPATTLAVTDLAVTVTDLTYPGPAPLGFEVTAGLPGAGTLTARGSATLSPPAAEIAMSMRGASITPYAAYLPVPARVRGTFNGESRSRLALADGRVTVTSTGRSWIEGLQFAEPGGGPPALQVARIELNGLDFAWPARARVSRVVLTRPEVRLERERDGTVNLRRLLAGARADRGEPPPPPAAPAPPAGPGPGGGPAPLAVEVGTLTITDGAFRFLDRTVQPAFSQSLTRLALTVEGLSSTPGRRARLVGQAIVGGDAALDIRGEVSPLGALYADLTVEVRDFALASLNPYADSLVAWIVQRGKLAARARYRIDNDTLRATNEIAIERLTVSPSRAGDEVERRIGVPLGLIVALVTDAQNSIRVNVPMEGPLRSWRADPTDAIWTAIKNAAVNILAAPFRAIGRLLTRSDNTVEAVRVEPVRFAPGRDGLDPEMARHLTAVAEVVRRAPLLGLGLTAVPGRRDGEVLRAEELTVRLQRRQREAGLPTFAAAVAAEYRARFGETGPPPGPEAQLEALRQVEPVPAARLAELAARRLEVVRDALVQAEGLPASRLVVEPAPESAPAEEGRVEFRILPAAGG